MLELSNEQEDFVEAIRDFARREAGTHEQRQHLAAGGLDHTHNPELYKKVAELGWIGAAVPEQYGGTGGGAVDLCLLVEETAYAQLPIGGMHVTMIVAGAYERFGSDEQNQEMLTGIVEGSVEAIAMSEPESGSDVGSLRCRADRVNGRYVLNGQKTWITAAHNAEHILVVCRTDASSDKQHEGISMISVPTDADGVEISGIDTMGGREVNDVFFTDTAVPAENLLGVEGQGWMQLMSGLDVERLIIAAGAVGQARRTFDETLAYIKERKQFGRPIGSFQVLRHRVADLATEIECARLLTYEIAQRVDRQGQGSFAREASMAKLKATEVQRNAALEGVQMMGGYGYASEYEMEQRARAGIVSTIYGGTSEIQREIIGRTYGL